MRQLALFADPNEWTRPDECTCDHCRFGVWQLVEPHRFYCIAPGMAHVTARNRANRDESCRFHEHREHDHGC